MSIKLMVRELIASHPTTHKWFVKFCARFTIKLYSLQKFLGAEDLRNKFKAPIWRYVVRLLDRPFLEKVVISGGRSIFYYKNGCAFNIMNDRNSVSNTLVFSGSYEQHETAMLSKLVKTGWTVVDAGANFGWYAIHLASLVGPTGKVMAFEPVPQTFGELTANVALNNCRNVDAVNAALGAKDGMMTIYVPEIQGGLGVASEFLDAGKKIEVAMLGLDAYLDQQGIKHIDFIKADIEGGEWNLLRGAERTLTRSHPCILLETVDIHCQRFGHTPRDVFEFLQRLGYKGVHMDENGKVAGFDMERPPNGNFFFAADLKLIDSLTMR